MKTRILQFLVISLIFAGCNPNKINKKDLKEFIIESYQDNDSEKGLLKKKRPKLTEVKEPTLRDSLVLPDWISSKRYITDDADAVKYEPTLLIGNLVRLFDDGTYKVYRIGKSIVPLDALPELRNIEKPTNFYEEEFDQNTRFNAGFVIGGVTLENNQLLKVTYTETNFVNLKNYDEQKLKDLKQEVSELIESSGGKVEDWAIIKGIVVLDCTYAKHERSSADLTVKASWLSSDNSFYRQTEKTNNFRLISIDLEDLFFH